MMCCDDESATALVLQQQVPHIASAAQVYAGSWLIQNDCLGATNECDANRKHSLHPTGQLFAILVPVSTQPGLFEYELCFADGRAHAQTFEASVEHQMLVDSQLGEQNVVLRHKAQRFALAMCGLVQTGEQMHGGAFAGAIVAQKTCQLILVEIYAQTLECVIFSP
ncbi:hypothetical protein BpHYR1_052717 [Brachionus plicatilis]|uniref:Uncharacterized protein n=1 Tax=Brachionus plicatilis TaxID=10195 RepID=A0A3M7SKE1_BRAPC|nr:hypothetical protein BpHYR1_052717 [Brachionus plicatilis]